MIRQDLTGYDDEHPNPRFDEPIRKLIQSCAAEISAPIVKSGMALDPSSDSQLLQAIRWLHRRHAVSTEGFLLNARGPLVLDLKMPRPEQVFAGIFEFALLHIPETLYTDLVFFKFDGGRWNFQSTGRGVKLAMPGNALQATIDPALVPKWTLFHLLQIKNPRFFRR